MKRYLSGLLLVVMIFSLCACGMGSSSTNSSNSSTSSETTSVTQSSEELSIEKSEKDTLIGLSMPTHSDESWIRHANLTMDNLKELGYTEFDVQWAEDIVEMQVNQIENLIMKGVDILIIAPVNGEALKEVVQKAGEKKIPVIAYDRLIRNVENVDCYITFDNFKVGVAEADYVVKKLGLDSGKGPFNLEIFGGSSDDNNSLFFYDGAMSVLKPYIDNGKLVVRSGQVSFDKVATPGWDAAKALSRMDNILTSNYVKGNRVDAVLVPYDGLSIAVISSLKNIGYGSQELPLPIVTGQDAEVASVKSILAGDQTQTVWKDFRIAGKMCAQMVDALLKGTEVPINDTKTYNNGIKVVPAYLCEVTSIDKDNVMELFDSGFYNKDDSAWSGIIK